MKKNKVLPVNESILNEKDAFFDDIFQMHEEIQRQMENDALERMGFPDHSDCWRENIDGLIHFGAEQLAFAYARIGNKFPSHPYYQIWAEESLYWWRYDKNIKDMVFKNYKAGEVELVRVSDEFKKAMSLEEELSKKK